MMQPQILLLKEGTDSSQGKPQLISNINACQNVTDAVRTTLGPRGMDKLIVQRQGNATISNDGATILKLLDIVHPAAKTLVDIAKSQDAEVGDGTTSVVLLAGEFLKQIKPYVDEGVHPRIIIKAVRRSFQICLEKISEISVKINKSNADEFRSLLEKCAATAMSSKLINQQRSFFSKMVVDAVLLLDDLLPLNMIGIKKVQGGGLEESLLVAGVAFKKTFSYAGFEMQPKVYKDCKIALLNIELELKAERDNAEVRVDNVKEYQKIVDAEWTILYNKLQKIYESGANVVLSKLPIGDVATQYFADRDMFCAGRVQEDDMKRTLKACGGAVMTTVNDINDSVLGKCELFEEKQIGGDRFNFFKGCPNAKTCTLILRGGAEQFLEETERSLHDAIMIVRRTIKNDAVVAGGGAIEMELSKILRDHSRTIAGKEQLLIGAIAKALEIIPRQLCDNAGFDATNILNKLRQKHAQGHCWYGVDINNEDISDNFEACVWEPAIVKINALTAATEATCLILSVDETIKNQKSEQPPQMGGRGMGRPM
ncbi:T-complex protein 1 subunit eta [Diabrotica undecimpunctata]|uniref:T-complex protein 1 subunit eta n=1 Tax=Diabrotica undecimpunctata TaxID=50387 RepID=UPI003996F5B2